jgi:hypothetical protein
MEKRKLRLEIPSETVRNGPFIRIDLKEFSILTEETRERG